MSAVQAVVDKCVPPWFCIYCGVHCQDAVQSCMFAAEEVGGWFHAVALEESQ